MSLIQKNIQQYIANKHQQVRSLLFLFFLFLFNTCISCEICGGSSNNPSIGLFASTNFHTLGLKTQYRWYNSFKENKNHSTEHFISHDLFYRFQISKRFQLSGIIPYANNYQIKSYQTDHLNGLGDILINSNFILISKKNKSLNISHFGTIGFGIKSPTGKSAEDNLSVSNLYPGSGAWDCLISSSYTYQNLSELGIQNEINYSFKGTSKIGYRKGNSLSLNSNVFKKIKKRNVQIIPSLGISINNFEANYQNNIRLEDYGDEGFIVSSTFGFHVFAQKWILSTKISRGIYQYFLLENIKQNLQASVGFQYLFKSK